MPVAVASEHRTGLYVVIPLYFILLILGTAIWAFRRKRSLKEGGINDELFLHFLAGRSFGPWMMAGTLFASFFSGYTVMGVPNEAFTTGFQSFRWLASVAYIAFGYVGTGLRLRKAGAVRNHHTPVDFITDRFRSTYLRYTIVLIQVLASLIYLTAQVNALKSTFNSMFAYSQLKQDDTAWPVIMMFGIMIMSECIGGMNSVVLSDCLQALIMLLSFVMLPLVVVKNFGGWSDLDLDSYPRPDFYQTPNKDLQLQFWQFSLVNVSFLTLPHLMMRLYAARDNTSLKAGWCMIAGGPWLTMLVGTFLGTVGVQMLSDAGISSPGNPFTAILNEVMELGGFPRFTAVIALTAALAAMMSTADSLLIALSQMISHELVYPMIPESTPREVTWVGRFAALVSGFIAISAGFMWKDGVAELTKINFPVQLQATPTFLIGLYANEKFDLHPWCLATGALSGVIFVFVVYFGYLSNSSDPVPINSGLTGVLFQIAVVCFLEICHRYHLKRSSRKAALSRPAWDLPPVKRFGDSPLTPTLLNEMMRGVWEPFKDVSYALLFFFMVTLVTPFTAGGEPMMTSDGEFVSEPLVFRGLPWFFVKEIVICVVPYLMIFWAIFRVPAKFPLDLQKVATHGINPDIVELTTWEMGQRTMYDETNVHVHERRNQIRERMHAAGISLIKADEDEEPDEAKGLLVALVAGDSLTVEEQNRINYYRQTVASESSLGNSR